MLTHLTLALSLLFAAQTPNTASTIIGDWHGTVAATNTSLVFHFDANGSGTADSVYQSGCKAMPLTYSLNEADIKIEVPQIHAIFRGTVAGSTITGKLLENGENYPLTLERGGALLPCQSTPPAKVINPSVLKGTWSGKLEGANLPLIFHLDADGTGTADSTVEAGCNMPLTYTISGNKVTIAIPRIHAVYRATVNGPAMFGLFMQRGENHNLALTKGDNSVPCVKAHFQLQIPTYSAPSA